MIVRGHQLDVETPAWQERIAKANAGHDTSKDVKIFRYVPNRLISKTTPPMDVDFTTGLSCRLHRHRNYDGKGRLESAKYYSDAERSNLIVQITYAYTFDATGFPSTEARVITWYTEDGSAHLSRKTESITIGDQLAKIAMMERWRSNQIRLLKMRAIELLVYTSEPVPGESDAQATQRAMDIGRAFLAEHKMHFVNYVEDNHLGVIELLSDATDDWLDNAIPDTDMAIRQYLLAGLG